MFILWSLTREGVTGKKLFVGHDEVYCLHDYLYIWMVQEEKTWKHILLLSDISFLARNPMKEVFPASDPIGKVELDAYKKIKDEIVTLMINTGPYEEKLENITSGNLSKWSSNPEGEVPSVEKRLLSNLQVHP